MSETEVTVLDIDPKAVTQVLAGLGAQCILKTRLHVDWYCPKGLGRTGEQPWYLRIRTRSDGTSEATWKAKSESTGVGRTHREINVEVVEPEKLGLLFEAIGLEKYAHQEKDRTSWTYKDWQFDLDAYPGMPPYLEIEGRDEAHLLEAIAALKLESHRTSNVGERILIQETYQLNWYDMRF